MKSILILLTIQVLVFSNIPNAVGNFLKLQYQPGQLALIPSRPDPLPPADLDIAEIMSPRMKQIYDSLRPEEQVNLLKVLTAQKIRKPSTTIDATNSEFSRRPSICVKPTDFELNCLRICPGSLYPNRSANAPCRPLAEHEFICIQNCKYVKELENKKLVRPSVTKRPPPGRPSPKGPFEINDYLIIRPTPFNKRI
jgi:hypothetical protein